MTVSVGRCERPRGRARRGRVAALTRLWAVRSGPARSRDRRPVAACCRVRGRGGGPRSGGQRGEAFERLRDGGGPGPVGGQVQRELAGVAGGGGGGRAEAGGAGVWGARRGGARRK